MPCKHLDFSNVCVAVFWGRSWWDPQAQWKHVAELKMLSSSHLIPNSTLEWSQCHTKLNQRKETHEKFLSHFFQNEIEGSRNYMVHCWEVFNEKFSWYETLPLFRSSVCQPFHPRSPNNFHPTCQSREDRSVFHISNQPLPSFKILWFSMWIILQPWSNITLSLIPRINLSTY